MDTILTGQTGRTISIKARDRSGKPRGRRRAGILHEFRVLRFLERSLAFAVVIKTELVHRTIGESPRVSDIPLLDAFRQSASEAWDIGAREFKIIKRAQGVVVVEVVINAQVLFISQTMVHLDRELVSAYGTHRRRCDLRPPVGSLRDELQEIHC